MAHNLIKRVAEGTTVIVGALLPLYNAAMITSDKCNMWLAVFWKKKCKSAIY